VRPIRIPLGHFVGGAFGATFPALCPADGGVDNSRFVIEVLVVEFADFDQRIDAAL
jgi:hypothetical protein